MDQRTRRGGNCLTCRSMIFFPPADYRTVTSGKNGGQIEQRERDARIYDLHKRTEGARCVSRRKKAVNCKLLPWLSGKLECSDGRFIQIGNSLFLSRRSEAGSESNPFVKLSSGAKFLYLCMAMESGGKREFQFPLAAAKKYGIANSSLRRNIEELIAAGMIEKQSGKTVRLPNLYEFCLDWKRPP